MREGDYRLQPFNACSSLPNGKCFPRNLKNVFPYQAQDDDHSRAVSFICDCTCENYIEARPSNLKALGHLHLLHSDHINKFPLDTLLKAFGKLIPVSHMSLMKSESFLLPCRLGDLRDDSVTFFFVRNHWAPETALLSECFGYCRN